MKHYWSVCLTLPMLGLINIGSAFASTLELKVLPLNGPDRKCPLALRAFQTPKPYQEGGYSIDGMVHLNKIATDIKISQSDRFSTTWTGTLKPDYRNCQASGGILKIDGENHVGPSYLRLQLVDGKAKFILDMTGLADINGYTSVILFKGMRQGNPRWTWGGTD